MCVCENWYPPRDIAIDDGKLPNRKRGGDLLWRDFQGSLKLQDACSGKFFSRLLLFLNVLLKIVFGYLSDSLKN